MARALASAGSKPEAALALAERTVGPEILPGFLETLSRSYAERGDRESARRVIGRAMEIGPGNPSLRRTLLWINAAAGAGERTKKP